MAIKPAGSEFVTANMTQLNKQCGSLPHNHPRSKCLPHTVFAGYPFMITVIGNFAFTPNKFFKLKNTLYFY